MGDVTLVLILLKLGHIGFTDCQSTDLGVAEDGLTTERRQFKMLFQLKLLRSYHAMSRRSKSAAPNLIVTILAVHR